jgi:hypothetical protein
MYDDGTGFARGAVTTVSAAASQGIAELLEGPVQPAVSLGSSTHIAWFGIGNEVVVLGDGDAVRQPNAVIIGGAAAPDVLAAVGRNVRLGDGNLEVGAHRISIVRWWDPHPALDATAPDIVRLFLSAAATLVPPVDADALGAALAAGDPEAIVTAAEQFIGRGTGLTPTGDDLLTGAFGAYGLIGEALHEDGPAVVLAASAPALEDVLELTSAFSATLVRHALAGRVAAPIAHVLRALVGRTPLDDSIEALLQVGETSGRALAQGVLIGAEAACRVTR